MLPHQSGKEPKQQNKPQISSFEVSRLRGQVSTAVGEYTPSAVTFTGSIAMHTADCCTESNEAGKKVIVNEQDSIKVTAKFSKPSKKYPSWAKYSSQCTSAKSEWDRFRNTVIAHENDHESIAKDFFTQSNVESYFDISMFEEETECLPESDVNAVKQDIKDRFTDTLISVASQLESDHYDEQEAYHDSPDNQFTTIDVSKECP